MTPRAHRFTSLVRENLAHREQRDILRRFSVILNLIRDAAFATLPDPVAAMQTSREIREASIRQLPYLLEKFEHNATQAGAHVTWARGAAEANSFITSLARSKGVTLCLKGKSMLSEEIGLREALTGCGVETYETDLGEFILQLADRTPFHTVGPSINFTAAEISDLFEKKIGTTRSEAPADLGRAARVFLRDKFRHADMGITGVNMAVADTGSIMLVENEGNIRLATSGPRIHVAVMGIERIVPTLSNAFDVLKVLTRSCTGQKISQYVSVITGPKKSGDADGPEELHIVIVDNGRSRIYADAILRSSLQCIKCGYCSAVCPVFTHIGGYAYGWVYSGPIGAVLNPLILGLKKARDLYRATTLCGACREFCPAGVDFTNIFLHMRKMEMQGDRLFRPPRTSIFKKTFNKTFSVILSSPRRYRFASRIARIALGPFVRNGILSGIPHRLSGWLTYRDLPALSPRMFRKTFKNRE
jgi:L-lactate dehydrogenase complex protein LldF